MRDYKTTNVSSLVFEGSYRILIVAPSNRELDGHELVYTIARMVSGLTLRVDEVGKQADSTALTDILAGIDWVCIPFTGDRKATLLGLYVGDEEWHDIRMAGYSGFNYQMIIRIDHDGCFTVPKNMLGYRFKDSVAYDDLIAEIERVLGIEEVSRFEYIRRSLYRKWWKTKMNWQHWQYERRRAVRRKLKGRS